MRISADEYREMFLTRRELMQFLAGMGAIRGLRGAEPMLAGVGFGSLQGSGGERGSVRDLLLRPLRRRYGARSK